jgi:hypothetical protein
MKAGNVIHNVWPDPRSPSVCRQEVGGVAKRLRPLDPVLSLRYVRLRPAAANVHEPAGGVERMAHSYTRLWATFPMSPLSDEPPSAPPRRITIIDVAQHANVSTTTVSKVLGNASGASSTARAKVRQAIDELGYRPHASARGMRGQTYTIGVMLPDIRNSFFADILDGVSDVEGHGAELNSKVPAPTR